MRHARSRRRLAVLVAATATAALAGCSTLGGSSATTQTLTAATAHGLSYKLLVTTDGQRQCVTASYRTALADGRPILQSSHVCGPPAQAGHPVLIQARTSAQSMVADVSATACSGVRVGPTHAALKPAVTRCAGASPRFRVTILPAGPRIVIVGIHGAPVINFSRHRCRIGICVTPLT
jgi:hypothetical protein